MTIRSPRGLLGSAILLVGVPIALLVVILFDGAGASEIIHIVLGVGFLLLALSTFDYRMPAWLVWFAFVGIGVLGLIFLVQGISDLLHSDALSGLAYGFLGQRLEKVLGYVFLLWALALLLIASSGGVIRLIGFVAFALVAAVEIYSAVVALGGGEPSQALKLLYLPVFLWLLLESRKPLQATAS